MKQTISILLFILFVSPSAGQNADFQLIFESQQERKLPRSFSGWIKPCASSVPSNECVASRSDFDGDGRADIFALSENGQGLRDALNVYDLSASGKKPMWSIPWSDIVESVVSIDPETPGTGDTVPGFMGVVAYQDGTRYLTVKSPSALVLIEIVLAGKRSSTRTGFSTRSLQTAIVDFNDDGNPELISWNPITRTIQVFARTATNTATAEELEHSLSVLFQNYPNPFNESTTIRYDVARTASVTIDLFDILGRRVQRLVDQQKSPGSYHIAWDGRDSSGLPLASGTYYYQLRVGNRVFSKHAVLLN